MIAPITVIDSKKPQIKMMNQMSRPTIMLGGGILVVVKIIRVKNKSIVLYKQCGNFSHCECACYAHVGLSMMRFIFLQAFSEE